jgi:hypothetical protein
MNAVRQPGLRPLLQPAPGRIRLDVRPMSIQGVVRADNVLIVVRLPQSTWKWRPSKRSNPTHVLACRQGFEGLNDTSQGRWPTSRFGRLQPDNAVHMIRHGYKIIWSDVWKSSGKLEPLSAEHLSRRTEIDPALMNGAEPIMTIARADGHEIRAWCGVVVSWNPQDFPAMCGHGVLNTQNSTRPEMVRRVFRPR